jgi:radical SAM superfamily enzyme YgiQ (UPF0313 family)
MSNLGMRLLYELINNREDALCERFFFTEYGQPPRSVESGMPMKDFDVVGFSLQHEMDYLRALDMISSSGIPLEAKSRSDPLIIAGGPSVTSNPMPLAPFIDLFVIGEVEPIFDALLDLISNGDIESASSLPGVFRLGSTTERLLVNDLDSAYHAIKQVHSVSSGDFASTFLLEVSRGCGRGCRFCMECYLYQPKRERSISVINRILDEGIPLTGLSKVTCISSALFDYSMLSELLCSLKERGLRFSLPSIRISAMKEGFMELLAAGGQKSITLAPETSSERLRQVINKRLNEDQLFSMLSDAKQSGINSLKLYFMIGIPGETESDIVQLAGMLSGVIATGFKPSSIHISVNPMIPKSNTPFQWASFVPEKDFKERLHQFERICRGLGIRRVESMDYRWGAIQAYLSTAGVEGAKPLVMLVEDLKRGGSGDLGAWRRVLKSLGKTFETLYTPKAIDSSLPWELIKGTISKSILKAEFERATSYVRQGTL